MIYVLLPAYNEEISLKYLMPKLHTFFNETINEQYHVVVCNDGSTDNTLQVLDDIKNKYPLSVINHAINRGLGETARDLFERAAELSNSSDIIIRMDCDDTHEPEYIKGLIEQIEKGADVVIASRFVEGGGQEGLSSYRRFMSRAANLFMKLFFPIPGLKEYSSGFRAYKASIIKDAIDFYGNDFIQLKGLGFTGTLEKLVKLKMLGAKFSEAPFILQYDQKKSDSKMVSSVTMLGYFVLTLLYHWPWGGWRRHYKKLMKKINYVSPRHAA